MALTERLVQAGAVVGVPVIDHIIVGGASKDGRGLYVSLAERGAIKKTSERAASGRIVAAGIGPLRGGASVASMAADPPPRDDFSVTL